MKLLVAFLGGLLVGVTLSYTYILSLRATIDFYRSYIHERIAKEWDEANKNHGKS